MCFPELKIQLKKACSFHIKTFYIKTLKIQTLQISHKLQKIEILVSYSHDLRVSIPLPSYPTKHKIQTSNCSF